jgi:hypothetical protein
MTTNILVLTVNSVNDPPSVSSVSDQVMNEDATLAVPFRVSDLETGTADLLVSAKSTNTTLIPNVNLVIGGSGTNRVLAITPAPDQTGISLITITLSDGAGGTTNRTFLVTVNASNDVPAITAINGQTIDENGTTGALSIYYLGCGDRRRQPPSDRRLFQCCSRSARGHSVGRHRG